MKKKKQKPISPQSPWVITSYSNIQYEGKENEFDTGYIEFIHKETGNTSHHEMDWLRADRSYLGQKPPTLIDVWNMLLKDTPGISGFIYQMTKDHDKVNWHITRRRGCFKHVLIDFTGEYPKSLSESIISDYSQNKIDMAAFLKMLDGIQKDCEDSVSVVIDLDEMRRKKEAM